MKNETTCSTHIITNSLNQGVVIIDKGHNVEFINKRMQFWLKLNKVDYKNLLQKSDKEFYKCFKELISEHKEYSKLVNTVKGKENMINQEIDIEMKMKEYKHLRASTTPVYDDSGYSGRIWVFEDITREKNMDKMKTEFISIASHQLRTPVTIIRGYLSMLTDDSYLIEDKEVKEYVKAAKQGSDRLVELIEDLLNISKLDMESVKISKERENIHRVFDEILNMHTKEMNKKNIKFEKRYLVDRDETFLIDLQVLINIVTNLVENAIKYTPKNGKIALKVSTLEEEGKSKKLIISVKDTGVGIPEEEQEKVFQKFFRAENVKNTECEGTGIGLYYVTRLLELLNGKITFSSKLGEGTEFTIEIPEK